MAQDQGVPAPTSPSRARKPSRKASRPSASPANARRFTRDQNIMGGELCFEGTRIPVRSVAGFANAGYSVAAIVREYPTLTEADVLAGIAASNVEKPRRTVASLSRLEKKWLSQRVCSFCETYLLSSRCGSYSGLYTLPVIEGVRDKEEITDLGSPCNMDERRAHALGHYRPRASAAGTRSAKPAGLRPEAARAAAESRIAQPLSDTPGEQSG